MGDSYSEEFNGSGDNSGDEHLKKRNSPGSNSSEEIRKAVERCLLSFSSTLDVSRKNIKHLTEEVYRLPSIQYFHLEGNAISTIPEDLFQKLPHLVWLDLRYNKIKALPPGIGYHSCRGVSGCALQGEKETTSLLLDEGSLYPERAGARRFPLEMLQATLLLFSVLLKRQLKTLLLERNPIKELPAELGNLTSLTALNLRHCPLEFPPKDVIQKGLKSILCFLRDSGKGRQLCMEPATSEMPPVEKLNLSELLQSSLDLSEEWPNEEEKLRFQKLKEEIIKVEKEEFLADKRVGAIHDFPEAGKNHRRKEQLCSESAGLCRTIRAKRAEKCRSVAEKELKEEQALSERRKSNREVLQEWRSQVKLMKEKREMCRFSPTEADMIARHAPCATDNVGYCTAREGAEEQDRAPEVMEERLLQVKAEATRSLRGKKLEQRIKQHMHTMKGRGEKLQGASQVEIKKAKQDGETVEDLQAKLAKPKGLPPLREHRPTAFTEEFPALSPRGLLQ